VLNRNGDVCWNWWMDSEREVREASGKRVTISLSHHHDDGGKDGDRANDDGDVHKTFKKSFIKNASLFSPQSVLQLISFFFARPLFLNLLSQFKQLLVKFLSQFFVFLFCNVFRWHLSSLFSILFSAYKVFHQF